MKKYMVFPALLAVIVMIIGCGRRTVSDNIIDRSTPIVVTVDEIMESPRAYVDSIVTIKGRCVHICKTAGNIMYLTFDNDSVLARCIAAAPIRGAFSDSILGRELKFTGMFREERLTRQGINDLREQYASHLRMLSLSESPDSAYALCNRRCSYERHFRSQDGIEGFENEMLNYEARIRQNEKYEGRNYLSNYYLETIAVSE